MSDVARIDGHTLAVQSGLTILDAARQLDLEIPSLCATPGLVAEGSCRLCLVEVDAEGSLMAACHTPLRAGMEIRTRTPRLFEMRRELLQWIADAAPAAARTPRADGNEFERLLHQHRVDARTAAPPDVDERHPYRGIRAMPEGATS